MESIINSTINNKYGESINHPLLTIDIYSFPSELKIHKYNGEKFIFHRIGSYNLIDIYELELMVSKKRISLFVKESNEILKTCFPKSFEIIPILERKFYLKKRLKLDDDFLTSEGVNYKVDNFPDELISNLKTLNNLKFNLNRFNFLTNFREIRRAIKLLDLTTDLNAILLDNRNAIIELVEKHIETKYDFKLLSDIELLTICLKSNNLGLLKKVKSIFKPFLRIIDYHNCSELSFQFIIWLIIKYNSSENRIRNVKETFLDEFGINYTIDFIIENHEIYEHKKISLDINEIDNEELLIEKLSDYSSCFEYIDENGIGHLYYEVKSPFEEITLTKNHDQESIFNAIKKDPFCLPFLFEPGTEPNNIIDLYVYAIEQIQFWYKERLDFWEGNSSVYLSNEHIRSVSPLAFAPRFILKRKKFFKKIADIDASTIQFADEELKKDLDLALYLIGKPYFNPIFLNSTILEHPIFREKYNDYYQIDAPNSNNDDDLPF